MRSSFFSIQNLVVVTNSHEIKLLVEKELDSVRGQNMFELEMDQMTTLLMNKSRTIESVQFQRHWPATLKIKIAERKGVALTFIDRNLWVVDSDGVNFKKRVEALPLFWPLPTERKSYSEALQWLESDHPYGVNGLTWDKELGLVILYDQKMRIILGRENFSANWKKATEAIEYLKSKNLQTKRIDATYNNRAVVSL